jgi:hypothetical protein
VEYLVKDLLSRHLIETIDTEIEKLKDSKLDQGFEEYRDSEILFSKLKKVEELTDDAKEDARARRYKLVSKAIMDQISGLRAEIDPANYDQLNIRENIKKIIDIENIRSRGFNTAINSLTSILDSSRMGYQYIENLKNAREVLIREYGDSEIANLPDERYQIKLKYLDNSQLIEERRAYEVQLKSLETEIQHVWDILQVIYKNSKPIGGFVDFDDLAGKQKNKIKTRMKSQTGEPLYEDMNKVWDEVSFVKPEETEVERSNRTYAYEKDSLRNKIIMMRERLKAMYNYLYPVERRVIEDRLNFLEKEYFRFDQMINPYHVQPGLVLDVDITSIKRKKSSLDGMANVLNEFLHGVSKGFQDAAYASYTNRRSMVGEDLSGLNSGRAFGSGEPRKSASADIPPGSAPKAAASGSSSTYLDIINYKRASKPAVKPGAKTAESKPQAKKPGIAAQRR